MSETEKVFPATVVRVLNEHEVVINRGTSDGIKNGQRFLVYVVDPNPVIDPETGGTLGSLEIIKGTGRVKHAQPNMATIISDKKGPSERRVIKRSTIQMMFGSEEEIITPADEPLPFEAPAVGDKVKPL